ncbi:MAG: prepilin-type N-terminal cleavage/methylation domain-containing protein, partial [Clostridium sp.]|nr:prepilin-type N-terminal cleavage/methylation domain-containing protein [Clostridium sp.]
MKKMLRNQKGFSLVELLIVIAIMGVLAALAFSMFAGIL